MVIAIWVLGALVIGLWTLMAWGLQALVTTDGAWIGQLEPWLARLPFGDVLESWFPTWLEVMRTGLEFAQATLGWLGGTLPVVVWIVWGVGTLAVVLVASLLTLLAVLLRRQAPRPVVAA